MSQISVSNLTFSYDSSYENIFTDCSFVIDTDWKLGFIGRNGRGKTTFFNLLLGKYEYSGVITACVSFDYFPFEVKDKTENTIDCIKDIYSGELWKLKKELFNLSLNEEVLYRPFDTLSNGEMTKVMLAALFSKQNNFLLIDEPTNHLDIEARQKVSEYLSKKNGFIVISHDRAFLDNCVDHILSINKSNIEVQKGNFTSWNENKKRQDDFETSENEKLEHEVDRLKLAASRNSTWSDKVEKTKIGTGLLDKGYIGHKSAKMMKRAKVIEARREKSIEDKSHLLKNIERKDTIILKPACYHKNRLIDVSNLSVYYGENKVCENINFDIKRGERIALCGKNGSGKSSILKILIGQDISYSGTVVKGSNMIISYVPQDVSYLKGDLKSFADENNIDESLFKALLRQLDFSRTQFEKDISEYSAGQKKMVMIAKSLCENAHLYIWDEPLNYIDIISRMQIEDLITNYRPTMVFVEHDKVFIEKISTKYIRL